ncbi:MAG: serine/threonine protein kinase, partial [Chlamydiia bacterium]|nr:serine/threonine protein kinase [Chlamydiia bacterium]
MSPGDFHKQETQPGVARRPRTRSEYPATIAGFKIDSILEEGGMSLVYLATHPDTGELITLKVLSPDFLDNEEILARFLKEASIIAMADHPNIVKLYTQGKWEGGLYIAMEYIPGISLHEMLKTTTLSLRKALEITLEVAYALCHLHSFGVIHRDLKPENILVGKNGHVKVIDFGIAQVMTEKGTSGTGRRRIIGTPVYMSPEQQKDPESVTYASDIYSLGIIAYELVLGKLSSGKVHLSLVPTKLQSILAKCLAKNPDERYQDVVDLIADLSLFMNEETVGENRNPAAMLEELFEEMKSAREDLVHKNSEAIALEMHDSSVSAGAV